MYIKRRTKILSDLNPEIDRRYDGNTCSRPHSQHIRIGLTHVIPTQTPDKERTDDRATGLPIQKAREGTLGGEFNPDREDVPQYADGKRSEDGNPTAHDEAYGIVRGTSMDERTTKDTSCDPEKLQRASGNFGNSVQTNQIVISDSRNAEETETE